MTYDQLLKLCRYYHGEKECPVKTDPDFNSLWTIEKEWLHLVSGPEVSDHLVRACRKIRLFFPEMLNDEHAPMSLKGMIWMHWSHYFEVDDYKPYELPDSVRKDFTDFMSRYYG